VPKAAAEIISVDVCSGVCVVTLLAPDLNSAISEELSTRLLGLLNDVKTNRFVLDFEQVRQMESSSLGALVTFLKWLARFDGKIALASVNQDVRFLFAVTKLDKVFPLYRDVPTALAAINK